MTGGQYSGRSQCGDNGSAAVKLSCGYGVALIVATRHVRTSSERALWLPAGIILVDEASSRQFDSREFGRLLTVRIFCVDLRTVDIDLRGTIEVLRSADAANRSKSDSFIPISPAKGRRRGPHEGSANTLMAGRDLFSR
jgi:hypothetical protein